MKWPPPWSGRPLGKDTVHNFPRSVDRFSAPIFNVDSIEAFFESTVQSGIQSITFGGGPLDLFVQDRGSKTTVVIFHAALSRSVTTWPVFSGLNLTRDIDANLIAVSDPSLSLGLELAWFAGNERQPLQNFLPPIIHHVASSFPTHQKFVFFGSSGGGFAALYYSAQFPKSRVLAINPQTNIAEYTPAKVREYCDVAWNGSPISAINAVTDLFDVYRFGFPNDIAYIQNIQDSHHRDRHLAPWLRKLQRRTRHLNLLLRPWGAGHVVPPADLTEAVLKALCEDKNELATSLNKFGFVNTPRSDEAAIAFKDWKQSET